MHQVREGAPMTEDQLNALLAEWGALAKYTRAIDEGGGGRDLHILHRNMDFAPGTRARAAARLAGRDGRTRRAFMARELSACGVRIVPADYVDPVPCKSPRRFATVSDRHSIPPHLRAVESASLELYRIDTLRGLVLRHEYCGYGRQADKADAVGAALGQRIGLRIYREALAMARGWMLARLSPPLQRTA